MSIVATGAIAISKKPDFELKYSTSGAKMSEKRRKNCTYCK
jgi:hypothetical protein